MKIVKVDLISIDEIRNSKGVSSIVGFLKSPDSGSGGNVRIEFMKLGSDKVENIYSRYFKTKEDKYDSWDEDGVTLFPVKIAYDDGSWEYGFKYYTTEWVSMKPKLTSLFYRVGSVNPRTGKVELIRSTRDSCLPMWLERAVVHYTGCQNNASHANLDRDDWKCINSAICSDSFCRWKDVSYSLPPVKNPKERMAWTLEQCGGTSGYWTPIPPEYAANPETIPDCLDIEVTTWRDGRKTNSSNTVYQRLVKNAYFKSVYEKNEKNVVFHHLIPMSSLLMVYDSNGNAVWDSINSTLSGDV